MDLVVTYRGSGVPEPLYPAGRPRLATVSYGNLDGGADLSRTAPSNMTWLGEQPTVLNEGYFRNLGPGNVDLTFWFEGTQPISVSDLHVYGAPDVVYREFTHGLVLANPSLRPVRIDLNALFPRTTFHRLHGSPEQDLTTNNGDVVTSPLTLPAQDGLFLTK